MRAQYESETDRSRERVAVDRYCQSFGLTAVKLPKAYRLDFALLKDERIVGFAEVKWRERAYETLLLSMHKLDAMRELASAGHRVRLIVRWPSGLWVHKVEAADRFPLVLGGRKDRGDAEDVEPMYAIPVERFEMVCDASELAEASATG